MNLIEVIERQDAIICELSTLCADLADELSMFRETEKEERRIRELLEGFEEK